MCKFLNQITAMFSVRGTSSKSSKPRRAKFDCQSRTEFLEPRCLLTTIVVQGPSQSTDAVLSQTENQNANVGGAPTLEFFRNYQGDSRRAVIQFDLASVASVGTANLGLYQLPGGTSNGGPMTADLYAVSRSWLEGTGTDPYGTAGGVSWNEATNSPDNWTEQGGDYNTTYNFGNGPNGKIATSTFSSATVGTWINFNVTSAVAAWKNGTLPNYGFIVVLSAGNSLQYPVASSENGNASLAPKLTIAPAPPVPSISVVGATVNEGPSGTTTSAVATIILSESPVSDVTVNKK